MSDTESKAADKKPIVIKNASDLQRLKLEKLMKNPEKPVVIPDPPKSKSLASPPDFVRNVMGSSAGAGSGEFHVYRHLRRKEYARQKFIQEKSEKEKLDDLYHMKIEQNRKIAEERTAKKRAKRLKKKKNAKQKEKISKTDKQSLSLQSDSSDGENEEIMDNNEGNKTKTEKYDDSIETVQSNDTNQNTEEMQAKSMEDL